jgi:hypothetical protein
MYLEFANLTPPVLLSGMAEAPAAFDSIFRYWPRREVQDSTIEPLIRVEPAQNGYSLSAPWLEKPLHYADAVNLGCGLAVHVNHGILLEHQELLCLHAAGVEIDGRLVVIPNSYHAGKSLLTACLAAAGARVFSDDILPIDRNTNQGVAIGLAPRLRLPLPDTVGDRSIRFIAGSEGARNRQYLYLDLDEQAQAPFGTQAPIGGFVLLDRVKGARAALEPVGEGEALKQLFLRNFARPMPPVDSLDYLHGFVARSACYRLTYSVGDEAADLLMARFRDIATLSRDSATGSGISMAVAATGPTRQDGQLRRAPGIGERIVGADMFLSDPSGEDLYHLNLVGAGLWRLLDGACSLEEAKSVLCKAFPDIAAARISEDVDRWVIELLEQGLLIEPATAEFD